MKTTLLSKMTRKIPERILERVRSQFPHQGQWPETSAKGGVPELLEVEDKAQHTAAPDPEGGAVARAAATASVAEAGPGPCLPVAKRERVQVTFNSTLTTPSESNLLSGIRTGDADAPRCHNTNQFQDTSVNSAGGSGRKHVRRRGNADCAHAEAYRRASRRAYDPAAPRGGDEACGSRLELSVVYEVEDIEEAEDYDHDGRPDMVDIVTVDVLSVNSDDGSSETFCEQNDHLLELQLDRRNLVLDSLHPEIAPHIVVSPPDDVWDYYWATWTNRIGPQDDGFLTVEQDQAPCPYASLPTANAEGGHDEGNNQPRTQPEVEKQTISSHLLGLRKVFSRSRHLRAIASALQERQAVFLDHIIVALCRKHYRAAGIAASLAASSFRARWDSPEFLRQYDKPLQWTDPAESLLTFFSRCPGTTIIDSVHPLTTPHIVIQSPPPPADPWALHANTTGSPQDCGYGHFLTVPSSFVEFVNVSYTSYEHPYDGYCPPLDESTALSPPAFEGSFPLTPDRDVADLSLSLDTSTAPYLATDYMDVSKPGCFEDVPLSDGMVRSACDVFEEDDGLPPFDEWYQDIARRAR